MTKNKIHIICSWYNIDNYTINDDLSIDVDGDVNLYHTELEKLPLKFRNVTGHFDCSFNNLTSLEGSPSSVGGKFDCSRNNLTTLEGSPSSIGNDFNCLGNNLTSLEGAPNYIGGLICCTNNPLESLSGISSGITQENLFLPIHLTYSDYLKYFRNLKFNKILNLIYTEPKI